MFLIAGVQPKTRKLDEKARLCSICGLSRAFPTRIDHYFSLFFIPLFRVKKGTPFLMCDRCRMHVDPLGQNGHQQRHSSEGRCSHCGGEIQGTFKFCPHCGKAL